MRGCESEADLGSRVTKVMTPFDNLPAGAQFLVTGGQYQAKHSRILALTLTSNGDRVTMHVVLLNDEDYVHCRCIVLERYKYLAGGRHVNDESMT